jgi:hypothetical protein
MRNGQRTLRTALLKRSRGMLVAVAADTAVSLVAYREWVRRLVTRGSGGGMLVSFEGRRAPVTASPLVLLRWDSACLVDLVGDTGAGVGRENSSSSSLVIDWPSESLKLFSRRGILRVLGDAMVVVVQKGA